MTRRDADILEIVDLTLGALTSPATWPRLLDKVSAILDGATLALCGLDVETGAFRLHVTAAWPAPVATGGATTYLAEDDLWRAKVAVAPLGRPLPMLLSCPPALAESGPGVPRDMLPVAVLRLAIEGTRTSFLVVYRRAPLALDAFMRVADPLQRIGRLLGPAAGIADRMDALATRHIDLEHLVGHMHRPAFVLDYDLAVRAANAAGRLALAARRGLTRTALGSLMMTDARAHATFVAHMQRLMSAAGEGMGERTFGLLHLRVRDEPGPHIMQLRRVAVPDAVTCAWPAGNRNWPVVLAVVGYRDDRPVLDLDLLRDTFHLTPSELVLAEALIDGDHAMAMATAPGGRGGANGALLTPMRTLMEKTVTRNQAELVGLLVRFAASCEIG